ncbi:MAG: hypothetical protein ACLQGP_27055 [Isosphaeraceae bacterium]
MPWLVLVAGALASAGCESEVQQLGNKRPETRAPALTGVAIDQDDMARPVERTPPPAQPKPKAPAKPEFIVGKRTQNIGNAQAELKQGKAQVASTRIVAKDPITLQGNAYVSIIGRASMLNMQHAIDLFKAENDRYPKDYNEFMEAIIKANNIALPKLPYYQEYAYDDREHKLIIIEYPDRK